MPYIRSEIPIFVVFRALGFNSDLEILEHIVYNFQDKEMINALLPSLEEAFVIQEQDVALDFIGKRGATVGVTKEKRIQYARDILAKEMLPHIGIQESDVQTKKAYFLGYMIHRLLLVALERRGEDDRYAASIIIINSNTKERKRQTNKGKNKALVCHERTAMSDGETAAFPLLPPSINRSIFLVYPLNTRTYSCSASRDHYAIKRLDLAGPLLGGLFRTLFRKMTKDVKYYIQKCVDMNKEVNITYAIKAKTITQGLKYSLATGNWGIQGTEGLRAGVSQVTTRGRVLLLLRGENVLVTLAYRRIPAAGPESPHICFNSVSSAPIEFTHRP